MIKHQHDGELKQKLSPVLKIQIGNLGFKFENIFDINPSNMLKHGGKILKFPILISSFGWEFQ